MSYLTHSVEGASSQGSTAAHADICKTLNIVYYNARSLLPKLDELRVMVEDSHPDVVCVTESWLCCEISNDELALPNYQLFRRDRDRHGGGVLIYVRGSIQVQYPSQCADLELLTLLLYKDNFRVCLSVFYRPPSSSSDIF